MSDLKAFDVIVKPVITEKSTSASEHNQVVFEVRKEASKTDIKSAIEQLFKVEVKAVNTILTKGKTKAFRGRKYRRSDVKKAIVTLKDGQTIDITSGL